MNIFVQMELHKGEFTRRDREIFKLFSKHPEEVAGSTATSIAERFNIPQSAISRFCKKIGFDGYGDFRMNMMRSSHREEAQGDGEGLDIADHISDYVHDVRAAATDEAVGAIIERISGARRVYTCGEAASSFPAQLLAFMLIELSLPVQFITSGWEEEMLHCMGGEDLVIVFSSRNPTHQRFLSTLRELRVDRQPDVLLVTHSSAHPLRHLADDVFVIPTWYRPGYNVTVDGSASMLFFCYIMTDMLHRAVVR